jgi:TPR repeat protein
MKALRMNARWPVLVRIVCATVAFILLPVMTVAQSPDAIEQLKSDAAAGSKDAQYQLGIAYRAGNGVPHNAERGVYWLQKAALQCSAPAMDVLGQMYLAHEGVDPNPQKAAQYFRLAAAQRYPAGLFDWGLALYENRAFLDDAGDDANVAPDCIILKAAKDRPVLRSDSGDMLHSVDAAQLKPIGIGYMQQAAALGEPRAKKKLAELQPAK